MMCTDFEMLDVKVPDIYFGAQGFSAHRDGRYTMNHTLGSYQYRRLKDPLDVTTMIIKMFEHAAEDKS